MPTSDDPRASAALSAYLGLGTQRTLKVLSEETGITPQLLGSWSRKYNWDAAIAEYDQKVAAETMKRDIADRVQRWAELREDHLVVAAHLRRKAMDYIAPREIEGLEDPKGRRLRDGMDPHKARLALEFLKYADQTERLDLGEPTERHALQGQDGTLSLTMEALNLHVLKAVKDVPEWREAQEMPALDDPRALGDFEL